MAMRRRNICLFANGLASSLTRGGRFEIQSSGMISTNPDLPDVSRDENLSAAAVSPAGTVNSLTSSSVEATEIADTIAQRRHSYQQNRTLLL
jgi:hypothetical protein